MGILDSAAEELRNKQIVEKLKQEAVAKKAVLGAIPSIEQATIQKVAPVIAEQTRAATINEIAKQLASSERRPYNDGSGLAMGGIQG